MLSTSRARVRALAVVGMVAVAATIGTVTYQASAAEVSAPAAAPAAALAPAAVGADARAVSIPLIPTEIQPPAGSRPIGAFVVAKGTQNYTCVVPTGATTGTFSGKSTPEAQLIGTGGRIHHFGGPSWESVRDGSLVTGAPNPKTSARTGTIPALLLTVATHSPGGGILSKADYINRLYTSGGVAPTTPCKSGDVVKVPYNAVYVFWDDPAV